MDNIDWLGSAPIDAFNELLKTLSEQGLKTIEVDSKTFLNWS